MRLYYEDVYFKHLEFAEYEENVEKNPCNLAKPYNPLLTIEKFPDQN